jgi:hypothetical protein
MARSLWDFLSDLLDYFRNKNDIDWSDPRSQITENFTVREALWLPRWNRLANEDDGLIEEHKNNLIVLFNKMETVRSFLKSPILVNIAYRPQEYNKLLEGAATDSAHLYGMAVDWYISGVDCNWIRSQIVPYLDQWQLRCEDIPVNWVHLDIRPPIYQRYFKP